MFIKRLHDLRIDNDLTQQQVADYLMCNRQVYARYERGLREIPVSMLIKLADFYKTSVDYILGRTDNPKSIR
jgi:transcriptional regulator with XRE-family HTH domain